MRTSNLGPLIAVLSLSAFSFTAGQYLSCVIAAISGSGVIATASLAIFTVSTIVRWFQQHILLNGPFL